MWDLIVSVPDHCLSFYYAFDVSFSCWCVRPATPMRKALFVTYNLNGGFECVLHWCWRTFCHKLCIF